MNAGGVDKACKSNAQPQFARTGAGSGERVSNTLATYLEAGHSPSKGGVIPDMNAGAEAIRIKTQLHFWP